MTDQSSGGFPEPTTPNVEPSPWSKEAANAAWTPPNPPSLPNPDSAPPLSPPPPLEPPVVGPPGWVPPQPTAPEFPSSPASDMPWATIPNAPSGPPPEMPWATGGSSPSFADSLTAPGSQQPGSQQWSPAGSSPSFADSLTSPGSQPGSQQWSPAGGPPPPSFGPTDMGTGPVALASWGSRAGALILDSLFCLLLSIPFVIIAVVLAVSGPRHTYSSTDSYGETTNWTGPTVAAFVAMGVLAVIWWFGVSMFIFGYQQGRTGQTWGKKIVNISVVDIGTGRPIGFWRSYGRWFVPQIINSFCGFFFILDYLWPLWDTKKQSLHDKMFNTCVIKS